MKRIVINAWILMILAMCTFNSPAQSLEKFLPEKNDLSGWQMIDKPEIYEGDYLFDLINGGAELYYEYGFEKVLSVHYTDPSNSNIQVEIYEMSDNFSAYGIFSISQQRAEWSQQFGMLSAGSEDYIAFWKSKYYVTLSWSSRQHNDLPMLSTLAGLISGKMPKNGSLPDIVKLFQSLPAGNKAIYLEGSIALSNFYYFDYKDIFTLKMAVAASTDEYHQVIVKYEDVDHAQKAVAKAKTEFENSKRFTDLEMTFQGFSCNDNKGNRILTRQIDNYLAILVALKPGLSFNPLIDKISGKIEAISP